MYFKTIISQQTCFTCQILPFCMSAWQVPCTGLSPLSIMDPSVFQMKPIYVFFLLPVFHINPRVFEISLCPNFISTAVYVLKPHSIVEPRGTRCTLGGHRPQQNLPFLLPTVSFRFFRYKKHQVACCLLQRTLCIVTPVAKPQAHLTPLCFLAMLHISSFEDRDCFRRWPSAANVTVMATLYNACFPHDVALKGCEPRQNLSLHE